MSYNEKTNTYPTRAEALSASTIVFKAAKMLVDQHNNDDPDLNETVTTVVDVPNKRYTITRPDMQEGIIVSHYVWEE